MANDNTKKFLGIAGTQALVDEIKNRVSKVSSTDNAIVRFNGTTGAVQNSLVTIADTGSLTIGGTWTDTSANNPFLSMGGYAKLTGNTAGAFTFAPSNTPTFLANTTEFRPISNTANLVDLGSSQYKWRNVYVGTAVNTPKINVATINNGANITVPNASGTMALVENVVNLTGNQTIQGTKTFTSRPALQVERLPSGYQEIEYAETDGTAYVDTGIPVHMNYKYKLVIQKTTATGQRIWGVFNQSTYNGGFNASITYSAGESVRWTTSGDANQQVYITTNTYDLNKHTYYIDNGEVYYDGVDKGKSAGHSASGVSNYNAFLGTINPGGTTPSTSFIGKIYLYQVWDNNGNLVQEFIPCIRTSDSKVGFYDTVAEEFVAPTGTFSAGLNVTDSTFLVFSDLADVATSGDYNDLKNKPTIPSVSNLVTIDTAQTITGLKTLVGQTKIKGSAAASSADNTTNGFSFWKSTTTTFSKTSEDYLGLISPNDSGALGFYGRNGLYFRPKITNGVVDTTVGVTMNSTGLFPGGTSMPLGNTSSPWGNIYGNSVHVGTNLYLTGTTIKKVAALGNTTATYTYTLPTATGTLALVGDNNHSHSGYVPYTGATGDVDLGTHSITVGGVSNLKDILLTTEVDNNNPFIEIAAGNPGIFIGNNLDSDETFAEFPRTNTDEVVAYQSWVGNNYQAKLTAQTAYTSKGSATKVPQITTNALGQVTGITEVTISQPTVNNGTLTIQANGTSKGTFTANQSGNTTINITASDLGLSDAIHFIGSSSTAITDGGTETPTISGYSGTAKTAGNVVLYSGKEYIWTGSAWEQLGDESSWALNSVSITGTGALGGGGTLASDRTITHNELNTSGAQSTAKVWKQTLDKYGHVLSATAATASDVGAVTKLSSTTDNAIVRFDGTSGEIQGSVPKIDDDGNITTTKSIFLQTVGGSVTDATASRLYFGTSSSSYYSYLASNTSGAFTMASSRGNYTFYPNTTQYNCIMTNSGSNLGRNDSNGGYAWGSLYTKGKVYQHKGGSNGFYEINWPGAAGTLALVGDNNHTHNYLPLTGGTLTGQLTTTSLVTPSLEISDSNGTFDFALNSNGDLAITMGFNSYEDPGQSGDIIIRGDAQGYVATEEWVQSQGYLTSHQSLSNYVTLNSAQTISGQKTFTSAIIAQEGITVGAANAPRSVVFYSSSANSKTTTITPGTTTSNITLTLPTSTGTLALVGDNNHTHSQYAAASAISGLVPYSGATGNVDLGQHNLSADNVTANSHNVGTAGYVYQPTGTMNLMIETDNGGDIILSPDDNHYVKIDSQIVATQNDLPQVLRFI